MKVTGEKISSMGMVRKVGLIARFMKVNILQERNMATASTSGMTNRSMRVNGSKIK